MRVGSNALELELNEAIVELGRTDFLLANFDLQALFVESLGKYYSEDVALWLQDKLTEGKLASFRRMADQSTRSTLCSKWVWHPSISSG